MAYQIDRFDNSLLAVVEDGTLDQTTNLKLIGKNYAGYGEIQNENFLFLLENFAGGNPPTRAIRGQVWYDTTQNKLKYFVAEDAAAPGIGYWKSTGGSSVSATEPTGLSEGDFWWDSVNGQLYVLDAAGNFVLVGPQTAGTGVTSMISDEVQDSVGTVRSIIKAVVNDEVVYIISPSEFTLNELTPIPGYDRIRKGLTLKWTKILDNGVTNRINETDKDFEFHGTASNAEKLGGVDANQYVLKNAVSFTGAVNFEDAGLTVGDGNDLRIYVENDNKAVLENQTGASSEIRVKTTNTSGVTVHTFTFDNNGLIPNADNAVDLGASGKRVKDIYAVRLRGEADQTQFLKTANADTATNGYLPGDVQALANTVAARDGDGNIRANLFVGTATQARFADLAENYTTGEELPVGTAVAVCSHLDHEVHPAKASDLCVGVISAHPAYLMNAEAEGQAVGLKGRVPVRVNGPVSKGMAVYAYENGVCSTIASAALVGIALETNQDEGEKLVECILKV